MNKAFINPVIGRITCLFGNRIHPVTKQKQFHSGVDIAVVEGTPIKCPADGLVMMADSEEQSKDHGGFELKVLHTVTEEGRLVNYVTGYAHLKEIKVKKGERVLQGNVIALSGHTGIGTGPHLHFTLRQNSNINAPTIDPLKHFDFKS